MATYHFIEEYEQHVAQLMKNYPIDEAMSLAVGGNYEIAGSIERELLRYLGLSDGATIIDLGCGSGRLASALTRGGVKVRFTGTDIVQSLLDYAKTKSDPSFEFIMNRELTLPVQDSSCDFFTAFSVFTHLLHHESYVYLQEAKRVLKSGGLAVFSFLEFSEPSHWTIFEQTVEVNKATQTAHLNMFIERSAIQCWAEHLGLSVQETISATEAPWGGGALGQSIAVLRKP